MEWGSCFSVQRQGSARKNGSNDAPDHSLLRLPCRRRGNARRVRGVLCHVLCPEGGEGPVQVPSDFWEATLRALACGGVRWRCRCRLRTAELSKVDLAGGGLERGLGWRSFESGLCWPRLHRRPTQVASVALLPQAPFHLPSTCHQRACLPFAQLDTPFVRNARLVRV